MRVVAGEAVSVPFIDLTANTTRAFIKGATQFHMR